MARYKLLDDVARFAGNRCFVCRTRLSDTVGPAKRTLEHLIPQWVIRRFRLEKATVTCDRLGQVAYNDYLLPCCSECNSHLLAPIEGVLSRAIRSGDPTKMSSDMAARWVAKLVLGTQVYARTATRDRSKQSSGEKLSRQYLAGLRGKIVLSHFSGEPFTMFWFRTKDRRKLARNFDFQIDPYSQALYMRLGSISMLARPDAGYIGRHGRYFLSEYLDKELAPLQMEELAAHFFTMANLAKGDHMISRERPLGRNGPLVVTRMETPRRYPFWDRGSGEEFLRWFTHLTGATETELRPAPGRYLSFLKDKDGGFTDCPAEAGWH